MDRWRAGENGAIAVLLAIVLSLVLIPLAGGAISMFVREATIGEVQRSADAGALAGARMIPLSDLPLLPDPDPALAEACVQARNALAADNALGDPYAGEVSCQAQYVADPSSLGPLAACVSNALSTPAATIPPSVTALPGWDLVAAEYSDVVAAVERRLNKLVNLVRWTVPILTKPGVQVTLTRGIGDGGDEPIPGEDAIAPDAAEVETKTATARRRVKNLALFPVVYDSETGEYIVDTNAEVPTADSAIAELEELEQLIADDPILGDFYSGLGCTGLLDRLAEDIRDVYNPGAGDAPDQDEILAEAQDQGAAVLGFAYDAAPEPPDLPVVLPSPLPSVPSLPGLPGSSPTPSPTPTVSTDGLLETLLDTLRIPFLDFVPMCVDSVSPLAIDISACQAADGALRATLVPNP